MAEYIIVHTRSGYLVVDDGDQSFRFTKDIAHATVFTNFDTVRTQSHPIK